MPFQRGDRIDRYVIDALLGAGGMGEVYAAHDDRLGRRVALKILRSGPFSAGEGGTEGARMLREARIAAALDHPNVVAVYDVGQPSQPEALRGTTFIAMELVVGKPMRDFVGDASVPVETRVRWLADVARALAAAHAAGLVHRDVKPENVMIRDDGAVKVLDFGIAKRAEGATFDTASPGNVMETLTAEGVVLGTPLYMAPEQMRAEAVDGRADQFSWGVMAYELLAGALPWTTTGGAIAVVAQILSATPTVLDAGCGAPSNVCRAVARALSKEKNARFPSMDALLAALLARSSPATRWRRRAVFGSLLLASVVAVSYAAAPWARARHAPPVAPLDEVLPRCTSSGACSAAHDGAAWACRASDGACVAIASEDCSVLADAETLASEDTVVVGALFPLQGMRGEMYGAASKQAAELAWREVDETTHALGAARPRRLALVSCDLSGDPMRAARHLVEDIGAKVILGFDGGPDILRLASSYLIPHHVVSIATNSSDPSTTRLPQPAAEPRLVWSTAVDFALLGAASAHIVGDSLVPLATAHAPRIGVLFVRDDRPITRAFGEAFYKELVFNGKSAIENGADYQEVVVPGTPGGAPIDVTPAITRGLTRKPAIIVAVSSDESQLRLIQGLERSWPAGVPRPAYVLPMTESSAYAGALRAAPLLRRRLFPINTASNGLANASFVNRFNETHDQKVTRQVNPGGVYDAFYAAAYAVYAIPPGVPADSAAVAKAFARLRPPGRAVEVGPMGLVSGIAALAAGEDLELDGTTGKLTFDPAIGEPACDYVLDCPDVGDDGVVNGDDVESGIVFHSATGKTDGTMRCP